MGDQRIRQAAKSILNADSVLLCCHVRPDGDALGSLLALGLGCEQAGRAATMVSPDGVPPPYGFLPEAGRVVRSAGGPFAVAVGLDADGAHRLGSAEAAVMSADLVIDIDHHTGPHAFGHLRIVDPQASATGELVYRLLQAMKVEITPAIATCLMTAIVTDTGSFRYPSVTPATLQIAADLVARGAQPAPIFEAVYERKPLAAVRLLARALSSIETARRGQIAWSALSRADFTAAGASEELSEGIINELRAIEGVRVALLMREEPGGEIRVSLRSRDRTDVARIAVGFGGGGHRAAAGCSLPGPLVTAVKRVVAATQRALAESDAGSAA